MTRRRSLTYARTPHNMAVATPRLARTLSALTLGALASIAAPSRAEAQTPIVLDATIAEATPRYFAVPFTVPEGTREIEVRHDDMSAMNILDWGLADPMRFRGWGGGNSENAVVSVDAASRSYYPGAIPAGTWLLLIGQAKIVERPARYHVEITLRTTPTLTAQPERRAYADAPALSTGPRWYAGDFHVHSRESGDASPTLDAVADYAHAHGLDFVELSEHNTTSQLELYAAAQARHTDVLFLPGIEVTTYGGHANAIGARQWVDFRIGSTDPAVTIQNIASAIDSQGALFALNHPMLELGDLCTGCAWTHVEPAGSVRAIEIENGQYSVTGRLFLTQTVAFWERYLSRGEHVAPIGGSDDHSAGNDHGMFSSPIGGPTTMVYATELSAPAIIAGVRAGRTVVKLQGAGDPMVDLRAGESMLGDTVRSTRATLRATVTRGVGASISFVQNGLPREPVTVTSDPFTATLDVDAPPGDVDDRWRCELTVDGRPRVITGHIWVAATGAPTPVDAGRDASTTPTTPSSDGCGCRSGATPRGSFASVMVFAALAFARRRRR